MQTDEKVLSNRVCLKANMVPQATTLYRTTVRFTSHMVAIFDSICKNKVYSSCAVCDLHGTMHLLVT